MEAWRRLSETDPRDFEAMAKAKLFRADQRLEEVVGVKMMRARAFAAPSRCGADYTREVAWSIWTHQLQKSENRPLGR